MIQILLEIFKMSREIVLKQVILLLCQLLKC